MGSSMCCTCQVSFCSFMYVSRDRSSFMIICSLMHCSFGLSFFQLFFGFCFFGATCLQFLHFFPDLLHLSCCRLVLLFPSHCIGMQLTSFLQMDRCLCFRYLRFVERWFLSSPGWS